MNVTDWLAIIGALLGAIGTGLGVITTWDLLSKNRVKLRVTPKAAWVNRDGTVLTAAAPAPAGYDPSGGRPPNQFAIHVVNLSSFAVTISEVGLGRRDGGLRTVFAFPELSDGRSWPVRLESREAVTAFCDPPPTPLPSPLRDRVAYAATDCGVVKYGTSPGFDRFVDDLVRKGSEATS
ncbi:MAG TPA: hypothetical protein VM243_21645 [Phycisphaerae bacterium]|nr:hypothetical protein [Phycisphaerae bacterium]